MALKDRILEVMGGDHVAAIASIDQQSGRTLPAVRFMATSGQEDLRLIAATMRTSRKVQQLRKNPEVAVSIWSGKSYEDPYVVIQASARVHEDLETRKKYWSPNLEPYFGTADNPEYVVLELVPRNIEYYHQMQMEVWTG
ncbi:MAG: pyridoxamine 5'-phosphate oxidase family protein [Methanosarcinales archaeon]|nr:pyridoxamine 5'-phosphate oxidase family protein [Methanosarcinales archaeon]